MAKKKTAPVTENPTNSAMDQALEKALMEGYGLLEVAHRGRLMTDLALDLRNRINAPQPRKSAPSFSILQLAELCGVDRNRINYLLDREDSTLPKGILVGRNRRFNLDEVREWVASEKPGTPRPAGTGASVVCVANFKGGQGKSSTAMCLAQGLTLKGRKVLLLDLDPQATLTEMCGFYAHAEISEDETIALFLASFIETEYMSDLSGLIKETYWPGLDLIPASSAMFGAEFLFPQIIQKRPDLGIWKLLGLGLDSVRSKYDLIVIDTAPSLSYMTVNALMAADSIIMPLVPKGMDFISSIQFWNLFSDLTKLMSDKEPNKRYDLIRVVLSMVNGSDSAVEAVRQWSQKVYGDWMTPIEIPESKAATKGTVAGPTVYDEFYGPRDGAKQTLDRLKTPMDQLCEMIDQYYNKKWGTA